ncbi:MAG: MMPL family transporter [Streptomycetales bacterium]
MFEGLGRVVYHRRRWVLALTGVFLAVAALWGTRVIGALANGGFEDPGSDSYRAEQRMEHTLGSDEADIVALYSSKQLTVDDPSFRAAVERTLAGLPEDEVARVTTYWSSGAEQFVSQDRHATYAAVQLRAPDGEGADEGKLIDTYRAIEDDFATPELDVRLGGNVAVFDDVNTQVSEDIARAEQISLPILLVLLLIIFGSLVAAAMPLAVGGLAILGAFTALRLLTYVTDVSIFAVNIVTMLGLGLAIDYALFIVSRFREELPRQAGVGDALVATMATAGRTVAFSGLTVALSMASLLLFPQVFLRSMAFGGMAAVLVAMVGALTALPALLGVLGHRVGALRVRLPWRRAATPAPDDGGYGPWARLARSVMRRPVIYIGVIVAVLVTAGLPFLRMSPGGVDARVLPEGTQSRVVGEVLDRDFARNATSPIDVVVTTDGPVRARQPELARYAERLDAVPEVTGATVTAAEEHTARVAVGYQADPMSERARGIVEDVRDVPAPAGSKALVGGQTAELVDLLSSLGATLPWMALFVAVTMMILLFLAFGSVVLPLKAVVMNLLSLTASFGAIVWIFQDGHLSSLLGFTSTGQIDATQPILMLAIAFGLSMDYEVFLLSRMREEWDRTRDNTVAVSNGLQRTGRIITSAALLLVVVLGAFSTSGITFIKMIGVGMVIAILIDATIVRALLVPATMRVLGRANWWAPGPLARFWERYGHHEVPRERDARPLPQQRDPSAPLPRGDLSSRR